MTMNLILHYYRFSDVLEGFSDVDWNTLLHDSKTISDYIFEIYSRETVSWKSEKHTILA